MRYESKHKELAHTVSRIFPKHWLLTTKGYFVCMLIVLMTILCLKISPLACVSQIKPCLKISNNFLASQIHHDNLANVTLFFRYQGNCGKVYLAHV